MEVWDLYNEKRELTGRIHIRGEEVPQGFYHLVIHSGFATAKGNISSPSVVQIGLHIRSCGSVWAVL